MSQRGSTVQEHVWPEQLISPRRFVNVDWFDDYCYSQSQMVERVQENDMPLMYCILEQVYTVITINILNSTTYVYGIKYAPCVICLQRYTCLYYVLLIFWTNTVSSWCCFHASRRWELRLIVSNCQIATLKCSETRLLIV